MYMPTRFRLLLTTAVALTLGACSPVSYNRDEVIRIPPQATVAFAGDQWDDEDNLDPAVDDDTVHGRIQASITSQLQSRGYTVTRNEQTADFLVRYFIGFRREPTPVNSTGALARATPAPRPGWGWGWGAGNVTTITPQDFTSDSLVVELVERSTDRIAWRAAWRGEKDSRAPNREEIDIKMEQIFRSAPSSN
jgi:Domain of unknown function (DUF4136)